MSRQSWIHRNLWQSWWSNKTAVPNSNSDRLLAVANGFFNLPNLHMQHWTWCNKEVYQKLCSFFFFFFFVLATFRKVFSMYICYSSFIQCCKVFHKLHIIKHGKLNSTRTATLNFHKCQLIFAIYALGGILFFKLLY